MSAASLAGTRKGEASMSAQQSISDGQAIHPVDLMFCTSEAERKLRTRLQKARDVASRRAWVGDRGPGARQIYELAQECSSAWVFRPASVERLTDALGLATRLFQAAHLAEKLEAGDA